MCEVKETEEGETEKIQLYLLDWFSLWHQLLCSTSHLGQHAPLIAWSSLALSLSPACLLSLLAGQLQQMGAVSHDPQPPPDPPTRGTSLNTHKSNAHTVYMLSSLLYRPPTSHVSHILQHQVATNLKNYFFKEFLLLFQSSWSEIKTKKQKLKCFLFHFYPKIRSKYI